MLLFGGLSFLGGLVGFCSLYVASSTYEHTIGTIRKFQTKRVYRYRKMRYEHEMQISYPTVRYGNLSVSQITHWPFRSVGDELSVWYHPNRPWDIRLPGAECGLWGFLTVLGVICIYGGLLVRKSLSIVK